MAFKARINQSVVDAWTPVHFISGFVLGLLLAMFLRSMPLLVFVGSLLIAGWEVFERWLKQFYDVFNVPFGRKNVYESGVNSAVDLIVGELGLLLFVFCIIFR